MPKKIVVVDYTRCKPEKCNGGVCLAALECEHKSLLQVHPGEVPEVNSARWCRGCAKCAGVCPLKAIRML